MTQAPDFALKNEEGVIASLAELRGDKPFLLLFSRFEDCPTTRRDLLDYGNVYDRLEMLGVGMAAVTVDTVPNHRKLKRDLGVPFPLLSDPDFSVSESYGVYRSDETDHGPQPHGEPAVFIVDVDGNLVYSQVSSAPKGLAHPAELTLMLLYMVRNGGRYW
ncbi:MAG TPA: redoxin domain-containing protein [Fimbriimonas sp.]